MIPSGSTLQVDDANSLIENIIAVRVRLSSCKTGENYTTLQDDDFCEQNVNTKRKLFLSVGASTANYHFAECSDILFRSKGIIE